MDYNFMNMGTAPWQPGIPGTAESIGNGLIESLKGVELKPNCPNCGASVNWLKQRQFGECEYCGSQLQKAG